MATIFDNNAFVSRGRNNAIAHRMDMDGTAGLGLSNIDMQPIKLGTAKTPEQFTSALSYSQAGVPAPAMDLPYGLGKPPGSYGMSSLQASNYSPPGYSGYTSPEKVLGDNMDLNGAYKSLGLDATNFATAGSGATPLSNASGQGLSIGGAKVDLGAVSDTPTSAFSGVGDFLGNEFAMGNVAAGLGILSQLASWKDNRKLLNQQIESNALKISAFKEDRADHKNKVRGFNYGTGPAAPKTSVLA